MGLGKTTQLKNFIEKHPGSTFLVVSSRISLSYTLLGVLSDFDHYSSNDYDRDRLVVQYESIHNIKKCFDYIVLDEVRSLLTCMTSLKTNRSNLRTNAMILSKLVEQAKMTITLDADTEVDGSVPFFLTTLASSKEIHYIRYTNTRIKRNLHFSSDEKVFVAKVHEALLSGKKICIGCQGKSRANM